MSIYLCKGKISQSNMHPFIYFWGGRDVFFCNRKVPEIKFVFTALKCYSKKLLANWNSHLLILRYVLSSTAHFFVGTTYCFHNGIEHPLQNVRR